MKSILLILKLELFGVVTENDDESKMSVSPTSVEIS